MSNKWDVVIVGAGIAGLATGYHIKCTNPDLRVIILERLSSAGRANTAQSAGAYRGMFTSEDNQLLAGTSIDFLRHLQASGTPLGLEEVGYLFLVSDGQFKANQQAFKSAAQHESEIEILERESLEGRIDGLRLDPSEDAQRIMGMKPIAKGVLGKRCGTLNVDELVRFYKEEFIRKGGELKCGVSVSSLDCAVEEPMNIQGEPFIWQRKVLRSLSTSAGTIYADKVVLAAGVWGQQLAYPVGLSNPIEVRTRQLFQVSGDEFPDISRLLHTKGFNIHDLLPFTIFPACGVYLRPVRTENAFWVGATDYVGSKIGVEDEVPLDASQYTGIQMILQEYLPVFNTTRPRNCWAGQYDYSPDCLPIVDNFGSNVTVIAGLSGSGVMKGDAVGRIAAACALGQKKAELYGGKTYNIARLRLRPRSVVSEKLIL
jgi:FAD-dependent oxidoreductase domain-containing protein 1